MRSPRTKVRESPTYEGKGVFAWDFIAKGTLIGEFVGPPADRKSKSANILWVQAPDGKYLHGRFGKNKFRYVNHSKKPNAAFEDYKLVAIQDIPPTVEITVNYGRDWY